MVVGPQVLFHLPLCKGVWILNRIFVDIIKSVPRTRKYIMVLPTRFVASAMEESYVWL